MPQGLRNRNHLIGQLALFTNGSPVVFLLPGGFPLEQFGLSVINADGYSFGISYYSLQNSLSLLVSSAANMLVLLTKEV